MRASKRLVPVFAVMAAVCLAGSGTAPTAKTPYGADKAKEYQKAAAEFCGVPVEKSVDIAEGVTMNFVLIPAGTFFMGSPTTESQRDRNEGPAHDITISKPYYLGKFEVTQKQWNGFFAGTVFARKEFKFPGDNMPADSISGFEAEKFLMDLSSRLSMKFRLPTEAEWEHACRAGTQTPFYTGDTISTSQANYDGSKTYASGAKGLQLKQTVDIGMYPPNPFGLHDMHGNVWEWCMDWFDADYYKESPGTDPTGPPTGGSRVIRGGCWQSHPTKCRSAERDAYNPSKSNDTIGFRVLLEVAPVTPATE